MYDCVYVSICKSVHENSCLFVYLCVYGCLFICVFVFWCVCIYDYMTVYQSMSSIYMC